MVSDRKVCLSDLKRLRDMHKKGEKMAAHASGVPRKGRDREMVSDRKVCLSDLKRLRDMHKKGEKMAAHASGVPRKGRDKKR